MKLYNHEIVREEYVEWEVRPPVFRWSLKRVKNLFLTLPLISIFRITRIGNTEKEKSYFLRLILAKNLSFSTDRLSSELGI